MINANLVGNRNTTEQERSRSEREQEQEHFFLLGTCSRSRYISEHPGTGNRKQEHFFLRHLFSMFFLCFSQFLLRFGGGARPGPVRREKHHAQRRRKRPVRMHAGGESAQRRRNEPIVPSSFLGGIPVARGHSSGHPTGTRQPGGKHAPPRPRRSFLAAQTALTRGPRYGNTPRNTSEHGTGTGTLFADFGTRNKFRKICPGTGTHLGTRNRNIPEQEHFFFSELCSRRG